LIDDGIDPEALPPQSPARKAAVTLNRDQFLSHVIMRLNGANISISDAIRYAANVAGGVHHDPRKKKELLAEFSNRFGYGGFPLGIRQLKAIARVALRGLQPLIEDVTMRERQGGGPSSSPNKSSRPDAE
jgi:hypothetical protein